MPVRHELHKRRVSGSIIVEGAAGLIVLVLVAVLFLLFLLNVGMALYYKIKVTAVTTQVADYAACLPIPSQAFFNHSIEDAAMRNNVGSGSVGAFTTWSADVQNYADRSLKAAGLPGLADGSYVGVAYNGAGNDDLLAVVTITVYPLNLIGHSSIIPLSLKMTDTATGLSRHDQPPCFMLVGPEIYDQTETAKFPKTVGGKYPKIAVYGYYPSGKPNGMGVDDRAVLRVMDPIKTYSFGLPSSRDGDPADVALQTGQWYEGIAVCLPEIYIANTYVYNLTDY